MLFTGYHLSNHQSFHPVLLRIIHLARPHRCPGPEVCTQQSASLAGTKGSHSGLLTFWISNCRMISM